MGVGRRDKHECMCVLASRKEGGGDGAEGVEVERVEEGRPGRLLCGPEMDGALQLAAGPKAGMTECDRGSAERGLGESRHNNADGRS